MILSPLLFFAVFSDQFKVLCRSLRCLAHKFEVLSRPLQCLIGPVSNVHGCYISYTITSFWLRNSVLSRVRNLRKMRNFWANFTDFNPEVNII